MVSGQFREAWSLCSRVSNDVDQIGACIAEESTHGQP
jgi:hypothetical protein